jgi:hypothetical protein
MRSPPLPPGASESALAAPLAAWASLGRPFCRRALSYVRAMRTQRITIPAGNEVTIASAFADPLKRYQRTGRSSVALTNTGSVTPEIGDEDDHVAGRAWRGLTPGSTLTVDLVNDESLVVKAPAGGAAVTLDVLTSH